MAKLYIYELILFLLNSCHSLINCLHAALSSFIRLLLVRYDDYRPGSAKRLRKLPLHLGLVVVEDDELSISDLARIVAWSMIVGISCVSVYDHKGLCKLREEELRAKSQKEVDRLAGTKRKGEGEEDYLNGCHGETNKTTPTRKNGYHKHQTSDGRIHVLGPSDGHSKLIDITREICCQDNLRLEDVNTQYVDSLIKRTSCFPDPDLVFRFGSTQSMLGYLPWHMRLTEILCLRSHRNLGFSEFFSCLDSFADIKQRCGV